MEPTSYWAVENMIQSRVAVTATVDESFILLDNTLIMGLAHLAYSAHSTDRWAVDGVEKQC